MIGLFQYPLLAALFAAGHTVSAAVVDRRNSMPTETKMAEGAMQTEMMKEGMSAAMMADMTETMSSMMAAATSSMSSMLAEAQMSSSSMMQEASAAYSSMMGYATSAEKGSEAASAYYAATTSATYYKPSYGSGSMSGSHDLNSCLESCKAQFGGSYTATGTATATSSSETGSGSGATHTVIVAPTKGVLRYVPFSVNANVGDTIEYMWGAGPHSVTGSDAFNICNRSTGPEAFDSGLKNATSTFQYKVSSNSTTFAYCTVPNHCAKGMFTVLNPPAAPDTVSSDPTVHTSVSAVMNKWAKQNASNSAMVNAVQNMQGMTPDIWAWGEKMDTKPMEAVDPASVMMSVLYTRAMFAMNPGMINGTVSANYVSPPELATLAANATAAGISNSSSSEGSPASAISSSTASAAGASETKSSGATIATAPTATLLIFASTLLLMTM